MFDTRMINVKGIMKAAALCFGLLFLVALYISVMTLISLSETPSPGDGGGVQPMYHFAVFLPDNTYTFFNELKQGAQDAGREFGCALSFHPIREGSLDFPMALYSGFDGMIVYPYLDEHLMREILNEINRQDVPIVLVEHDLQDESPWPFVGTNNFDVGKKIGELISQYHKTPVEMAVVYSDKSPGIYAERELVEMGINAHLGDRLAAPITSKKTDLNPLDAELLMYHLLRDEPNINTVVFTDSNDTLAATQVVIDMNLVGSVQIIGFGTEEPILEYIEKHILLGTIAEDPRQIGYNSVKALKELKEKGHTPSYVDTGVQAVTRRNVSQFRNGIGGQP